MTTDGQWVGDIGHLALADAMLGALLVDLLDVLAHATYPQSPSVVDHAMTTRQAARAIERRLDADASLFPDDARAWLTDVLDAAELRNHVLHAVALDRCVDCGSATMFVHPRTGKEVDRSEEAVRALTANTIWLQKLGLPIARAIAARVNSRIVDVARAEAEATSETQNPPQVSPSHVVNQCASCADDGRPNTTVHIGPAIAILPSGQKQELLEQMSIKTTDHGSERDKA